MEGHGDKHISSCQAISSVLNLRFLKLLALLEMPKMLLAADAASLDAWSLLDCVRVSRGFRPNCGFSCLGN